MMRGAVAAVCALAVTVAAVGATQWAVDASVGDASNVDPAAVGAAPRNRGTPRRPPRRNRADAATGAGVARCDLRGEAPPDGREPSEAGPPPPASGDDDPARIVGCVVDTSGAPVAGARICAFLGTGTRDDVTAADGRFTVDVQRPTGVTRCIVWADDLAATLTPWAALDPGVTLDLGTVTLRAAERIEGRVVARDGGILFGATVGIDGTQTYGYDEWCLISYCTDLDVVACDAESGAFHSASLRAGPYSLDARSRAALDAYPFPVACPSTDVDLRMDRRPPDVTEDEQSSASSPDRGSAGRSPRGCRFPAGLIPPDSREPDDPPPPPPHDEQRFACMTFSLHPPADAAPLDRADVAFHAVLADGTFARRWPHFEFDRMGGARIRVPDLPIGDVFRVVVSVRAGRDWLRPLRLDGVRPGGPEIDVRLSRGPTLAGQVVRHDGTPVVGAWIRAERAADGVHRDAHSLIGGRYALTGLDAGRWGVSATAPGWAWRGTIDVPESGLPDRTITVAPDRP